MMSTFPRALPRSAHNPQSLSAAQGAPLAGVQAHCRPSTANLSPAPAPRQCTSLLEQQQQQFLQSTQCTLLPRMASHPCFTALRTAQRDVADVVANRQTLTKLLQEAIKKEDYKAAAELKRDLEAVNAADPVLQLQAQLKLAIEQERYQDAAALKAELKTLTDELDAQAKSAAAAARTAAGGSSADSDPTISISSDTVTNGIRVKVFSFYVPAQSEPRLEVFFFAYSVTIKNESDKVVQLRSRHWVITDTKGHFDEVRGPGVVGKQPILNPGQSHEYRSGCPLRAPSGAMEGEYTFAVLDEADGEWRGSFQAKVGKFKLDMDSPSTA